MGIYANGGAPFHKTSHVLAYLGRYTHRVGIANSRLLKVSDSATTFRTKGDATETVTPVVFLSRFVTHVLPVGLHKIRHVGLYASACTKRLELARAHLGTAALPVPRPVPAWREMLRALTGRDASARCAGRLISIPCARAPPRRAA